MQTFRAKSTAFWADFARFMLFLGEIYPISMGFRPKYCFGWRHCWRPVQGHQRPVAQHSHQADEHGEHRDGWFDGQLSSAFFGNLPHIS